MNRPVEVRPHRFFVGTRALPCPYIPGRTERKIVTDLATPKAAELYDRLSRAGFRRSHSLAYRPACPGCSACVPVRINVSEFKWTRTFRRLMKSNADLAVADMVTHATMEQYRLFTRYQRDRHTGGEMSTMGYADYRMMVEDSPIDTRIIEFRGRENELVACMLADRQIDALSAVYSMFDTALDKRSLGTYMVLWMVERAQEAELPFVYLGYYIEESPKMSYKTRFHPLEGLGANGWEVISR
jgi:arginine-tRNA-protein transferase